MDTGPYVTLNQSVQAGKQDKIAVMDFDLPRRQGCFLGDNNHVFLIRSDCTGPPKADRWVCKTMRGAKSNALSLRRSNWNCICPFVAPCFVDWTPPPAPTRHSFSRRRTSSDSRGRSDSHRDNEVAGERVGESMRYATIELLLHFQASKGRMEIAGLGGGS
jgi:hypothetical protein